MHKVERIALNSLEITLKELAQDYNAQFNEHKKSAK